MHLSRSPRLRSAFGVVMGAVVVIGCSSESVTRPSISPQETAAAGLDSAYEAAVPGSERQGMLGFILSSLGAGAPVDLVHFTVNGKAVSYPAVATYTVATLGGSLDDSAYSAMAWSGDAGDTIWLFEFDRFGPKLYMTTVDSVNYAAPSTTTGSAVASAPAGSCVPLGMNLPEFGTPGNIQCRHESVSTTLSGRLDAPGAVLNVELPTQSLAGIRVQAALLSADRGLPSPSVTGPF